VTQRVTLRSLVENAAQPWGLSDETTQALYPFLRERVIYLFEQRGFDIRNARAVVPQSLEGFDMVEARKKLEALSSMMGSVSLLAVAELMKRVKNITKGVTTSLNASHRALLKTPEESGLLQLLDEATPVIGDALSKGDYSNAFHTIGALRPVVAGFFDKVMVMSDDMQLREARLALVATLRDLVLGIADISEIVTES
jgi:glycyl-tRNA synthetase beta chain